MLDDEQNDFFSSQQGGVEEEQSPTLQQPLFFGDGEDDEEEAPVGKKAAQAREEPVAQGTVERKRIGSQSEQDLSIKRTKVEQEIRPTPMSRQASSVSDSPSEEDEAPWDKRFIGTFIIPAWSLSKGSNYVQQGDKVQIQRQKPKQSGQASNAKLGKNGLNTTSNHKQTKLTFGSAGAALPLKKAKVKEDYVVRFSNMRGFEVGRVATEVSGWMSKLMDQDIAHFEGFVVDCPPTLTVGCDLLLEIRAFLLRSAFPNSLSQDVSFANSHSDASRGWRAETAESDEEKRLRERKVSLVRLFRACTLRASISNDILRGHQAKEDLGSDAMMEQYGGEEELLQSKRASPEPSAAPIEVKEENGDARPRSSTPDIDDGTELSENQLDNVYSKAQLHDPSLPEVEPAEGFALTLRPYQKQALGWMLKMEEKSDKRKKKLEGGSEMTNGTSDSSASRELSLHPLWQEYRFPIDEEKMDLLDSAAGAFYFNPYTGHLSLRFQHASRGARGGILADEMGLGKTIQMAALILSNQPRSEDPISEEDEEDARRDGSVGKQQLRQMSLASSFKAAGSSDSSRKAMLKSLSFASQGRATLVVAPMSLIGQWRDEMDRAIPSMTSMLYYAESKGDLIARLEGGSVDIVITSYGTLVTEYKKFIDAGGSSARHVATSAPLYAIEWLRVILDEAHHIKNKETKNSKACSELLARRRWCLTGTPIVNRLTDLYSLLRFLRVEPWGDFSFFNSFISKPFANKNPKALEIVQVVLESVLMRREKKMKDKDGKPIVDLPPKKLNVVRLKFSPLEREIYDSVYSRAYMQYQTLAQAGTISKNFSFIFSVLMRLRQAVCHPLLVLKGSAKKDVKNASHSDNREPVNVDGDDEGAAEATAQSILGEEEERVKKLIAAYQSGHNSVDSDSAASNAMTSEALEKVLRDQEEDDDDKECPFCFEEKSEMCFLPCKHWGCKQCILDHLQLCEDKGDDPACPTCRAGPVSLGNIVSAIRTRPRKNRMLEAGADADYAKEDDGAEENGVRKEEEAASSQHSQPEIFFRRNDFRSSTKLEALIEHLNQLRYDDPTFKGVIFSQFTSFLDLVEVVLRKNHHSFVRLDGTTSQKDREAVLREFSDAPRRMLILISLRAGGVGLNLVAANHVWLLDCWWNCSTEDQAVDRVHRLGQTRQVYVHRFLIDESIEDRILGIQKRKTALVGAALAGTRGPGEKSEALQNLELLFA